MNSHELLQAKKIKIKLLLEMTNAVTVRVEDLVNSRSDCSQYGQGQNVKKC